MPLIMLTRLAITIAAIILVYRLSAGDRDEQAGRPRRDRWSSDVLSNLVLLSIVLYLGLMMYPMPWVKVHHHDIFHYYMGAKYSPEVGYTVLYESTVVAESENLGRDPRYSVRRMDNYRPIRSSQVLRRADEYRARFTPERWEEFKRDVAVFRERLGGEGRWTIVLGDNGYNATPVWNMIARPITNAISVQWPPGTFLLACFDIALLILAFVSIGRTFDRRTAWLAVVFLGTLVTMADGTIRGAFLRLDWLVMLVLATCALKRNRYKTAGALVAYAGMVRIFPMVFLFGLGAKAAWDFLTTRRLNRRHVEFFLVFALVAAALFTLSISVSGSFEDWETFWAKIRFHDTHMSPLRVGFKTLFLAAVSPFMEGWPPSPMGRSARAEEVQGLLWSLQALVLIGAFFAVRRVEDYETIPFGWVLVYFLAAPTHYYQVVLLPLSLLFIPKLVQRVRVHGLALLFGISVVGYLLMIRLNLNRVSPVEAWRRFDYAASVSFSGMLLLVALYVLGLSFYTSFIRPAPPSSAGAIAPGSGSTRSDPPTARG